MRWLVGTYGEAIGEIVLDPRAGRLSAVGLHPCPPNPSFLAPHPHLPVVYAVHELRSWQGGVGGAAAAYALASDGSLAPLGAQPTGGSDPCHLATDAAGRWLVVANYSSGHVTSLPIGPDGGVGPAADMRAHAGASLHPVRQTHPHPHHVAWRDGRLLVSDLGLDRLVAYRLDPAGRITPAGPDIPTPPGGGPRRILFHPTLPCGWVLNELQASLTRISFATDGSATRAETVPMLPAGHAGRVSGAEVQIAPSGRFLYASNRGHDSIARFAVDAASGALTPSGHTPSGGAEPRHFAISPCGDWLLAANQNSGTVVLFAIDPASGALEATGQSVAMPKPVCLLHIPQETGPMMLPTRLHRPLQMGRHGAVGSNHPQATLAGLDVLRAGGNAVDAAVAVSLALGVCEPSSSGLGGDGFYHVHDAATGAARVFNGSGVAPLAATAELYADGIPNWGPRSVSVPGLLAGVAAMHAAHGSRPWAGLVAPAITLARDGFAATHTYCRGLAEHHERLAADPRSAATFLGKRRGDMVLQPDLARTLEEIAADGADTFYRGRLATRLAAAMRAQGVAITQADLARFQPDIQAPIAVLYRGWEVRQTPPNSTGFTLLQMLKIAERFDLRGAASADALHILVEAKKRAFMDRERYGADPRFQTVPLDLLLSEAHADAHAAAIDMTRAATVPQPVNSRAGDTTYFAVVDAAGNAVSAIQSINSGYGSGVTAGDTGVLLNNRMAYWHLAAGHPNRLQPGKRVRHTMNAPMVYRDGRLAFVLGTPGADNQVQVNLQVLVAMLDHDADPQTALEAPRWTSSQAGQGANWLHDGDTRLTIETDFSPDLLSDLERRGHVLHRVGHLMGPCAMQAIQILPNGIRAAGSDPRRDGWALAY